MDTLRCLAPVSAGERLTKRVSRHHLRLIVPLTIVGTLKIPRKSFEKNSKTLPPRAMDIRHTCPNFCFAARRCTPRHPDVVVAMSADNDSCHHPQHFCPGLWGVPVYENLALPAFLKFGCCHPPFSPLLHSGIWAIYLKRKRKSIFILFSDHNADLRSPRFPMWTFYCIITIVVLS